MKKRTAITAILAAVGMLASCGTAGPTSQSTAPSVAPSTEPSQSVTPSSGSQSISIHTHDYGTLHARVEPTCTTAGKKAYYHCEGCGKFFDEQKAEVTEASLVLEKLGHATEHVTAKAPSCTAAGNIEYYHCTRCQKNFDDAVGTNEIADVVLPAINHKNATEVAAVAPSCFEDGIKYHWHCPDCKKDFTDNTFKTEMSSVVDPKLNHKNATEVAAKAATCTADGNIHHWHCPDCNKNYEDNTFKTEIADVVLPKLSHKNATEVAAVAPNCYEDGKLHHWHCPDCLKNFTDNTFKTEMTSVVDPKLNHKNATEVKAVAPSCFEDGVLYHWHCPDCNKDFTDNTFKTEMTSVVDPKLSHKNATEVAAKAATCTAAGNVYHWHCPDCNKNFEDNTFKTEIADVVLPATGHTYGDVIAKVDKNRGTDGMEAHYECSECHALFDTSKNPTTAEALKIANTLVNVEEALVDQKDSTYIPYTWSIDKILYLDVKVDSDLQGIYIGFMDKNNGWKRTCNAKINKNATFSYTDFPKDVTTKDGVYILGKTADDYVRVKFDISKMGKEAGFVGVTDILIYKWAHSSGKIDINPSANIKTNEFVIASDTFTVNKTINFSTPVCKTTEGKLVIKLEYTDATGTVGNPFQLLDTNFDGSWNHGLGYYNVKNEGTAAKKYTGFTVEVLETNKIKITLDLSVATGSGATEMFGTPYSFNAMFFRNRADWGDWTGTGQCTVSFIANDIVY